ncbi:MAG: hypothetical protein RR389_07965, partial [Christensenella sp.]
KALATVMREHVDNVVSAEMKADKAASKIEVFNFAADIKDKGISNFKDLGRNLDAAAGGNENVREILSNMIERPLYKAKAKFAKAVKKMLTKYYNASKKYGIKKGSKESAAVQWIGEGERQTGRMIEKDIKGEKIMIAEKEPYTLAQLKKDFPTTWKNIVEYEKVNREIYDYYVDAINESLKLVYPNALENAQAEADTLRANLEIKTEQLVKLNNKLAKTTNVRKRGTLIESINRLERNKLSDMTRLKNLEDGIESGDVLVGKRLQKRKDYYHHFQEMESGFTGLMNLLTAEQTIDPKLAGISEFTKPLSKFAGFMQRRGNGRYTEDAVGGMLEYIQAAEYKVHIDPIIARFRRIITELRTSADGSTDKNAFIEWFTDYTNDLAGKTNPIDRGFLFKLVGSGKGRKVLKVIEWLSNRTKSNAVMLNLNSAASQWFNIPNGIALIKDVRDLARGLTDYISYIKGYNTAESMAYESSGFMNERYIDKYVRNFDYGILGNINKFASWVME